MKLPAFVLVAFLMLPLATQAQDTLTAQAAIELALGKHLGLKIAENSKQIAQNNATRGAVGMLPEVNLTSALGASNANINQRFANGQEQSRNFASSANGAVGVALNWTIFDGKRMHRTLDRLQAQATLSDFELRLQTEQIAAAVLTNVAQGIRQQQLIKATRNNLAYYDERIRLATVRFAAGVAGKNAQLQTEVDKNVQQSLLLQAENALEILKMELNALLLRDAQTVFTYPSDYSLSETMQVDSLAQVMLTSNRQLRLEQQRALIAEKAIAENEALYKPRVGLNAAYNYNLARNQAGFLLYNQNYGLNTGLNLQWNLYNGHNTKRQVDNARLQAASAALQTEQVEQDLRSDLYVAHAQWRAARQLIDAEERNLKLCNENLEINQERFRLGGSDVLPVKEAQKSYEDAQIRLINARFQVKMAEIMVFRLCGVL